MKRFIEKNSGVFVTKSQYYYPFSYTYAFNLEDTSQPVYYNAYLLYKIEKVFHSLSHISSQPKFLIILNLSSRISKVLPLDPTWGEPSTQPH